MSQGDLDDVPMRAERAEAAYERGRAYAARRQWQQALRALSAALGDAPEHIEAHRELARCHAQMGNGREALRLLDQALELPRLDDASKVGLLQLLGRVSIQNADYHRASEAFQEALDITGTGGAPILNQLAEVMCKSGDFDRGFALFFRSMGR